MVDQVVAQVRADHAPIRQPADLSSALLLGLGFHAGDDQCGLTLAEEDAAEALLLVSASNG